MNQTPTEKSRNERTARLIEVGLSVAAATITSAIVATWSISATLAAMDARIDSNAQAVAVLRINTDAIAARDIKQQAQLAGQEAHYQDIARRLDAIDRKLDRVH